jgi:hypothetical protein
MALQKQYLIQWHFDSTLPNQLINTFDQWLNVALQQNRIGIRPTKQPSTKT